MCFSTKHELIEEQQKCDQDEELEFYEMVCMVLTHKVQALLLWSFGIQIRQLHQMEEKAERDFKSFVERTSNYKALKVI